MSLSVRNVAVRLNVSEKTVYKWLKTGLIPANRIGKSWIITEESVLTLVEPKQPIHVAGPRRFSTVQTSATTTARTVSASQPSTTGDDAAHLARFTNILSGALDQGMTGILGPRATDPETSSTIASVVADADGEILLQGIGLREFFGDRGHTAILKQMAAEDRAVQIRAILVNPVSEFARARAVAEDGAQFVDEDRFKAGPLYNDSWRSLNVIAAMKKDAASRAHFGIDVRFVDHWPSVYLVMTGESTFVETYQFGQPNAAVDGSWSGTNPHVRTHSLADIAEAMHVDV
jgi:excisionase family DNA binding protein